MERKEFDEKLKGINQHLDIIFDDNKKAAAIIFLDDNGDYVLQRPVFVFKSRTWYSNISEFLTDSERTKIQALLLNAMGYLKGPDLFDDALNTEILDKSPSVKQVAKVMSNVQKVAKKTSFNNPFLEYTNYLADVLQQKNLAYGDSFGKSLDEDGLLVLKIRLGDKFNRISSLIKRGELKENDESLEDTLLDLAGYSILGLKWLKKHEND